MSPSVIWQQSWVSNVHISLVVAKEMFTMQSRHTKHNCKDVSLLLTINKDGNVNITITVDSNICVLQQFVHTLESMEWNEGKYSQWLVMWLVTPISANHECQSPDKDWRDTTTVVKGFGMNVEAIKILIGTCWNIPMCRLGFVHCLLQYMHDVGWQGAFLEPLDLVHCLL